jgi:hypothetical protein
MPPEPTDGRSTIIATRRRTWKKRKSRPRMEAIQTRFRWPRSRRATPGRRLCVPVTNDRIVHDAHARAPRARRRGGVLAKPGLDRSNARDPRDRCLRRRKRGHAMRASGARLGAFSPGVCHDRRSPRQDLQGMGPPCRCRAERAGRVDTQPARSLPRSHDPSLTSRGSAPSTSCELPTGRSNRLFPIPRPCRQDLLYASRSPRN